MFLLNFCLGLPCRCDRLVKEIRIPPARIPRACAALVSSFMNMCVCVAARASLLRACFCFFSSRSAGLDVRVRVCVRAPCTVLCTRACHAFELVRCRMANCVCCSGHSTVGWFFVSVFPSIFFHFYTHKNHLFHESDHNHILPIVRLSHCGTLRLETCPTHRAQSIR